MEEDDNELIDIEEGNSDLCKVCNTPSDPYNKPALQCSGGCSRSIHLNCLKRTTLSFQLLGDVFFSLTCCDCDALGNETVTRAKLPWLNVIILALYNLREKSSGISKRGYFHWKSDISSFVDRNWDYFFSKNVKKKKNWIGTISGTLSHYSGTYFESGTVVLDGEPGWWKLCETSPPEVLIAKNSQMIMERKKQSANQQKSLMKPSNSPNPSESSIAIEENSCGESSRSDSSFMYTKAYVQPSETLSNFLFDDEDDSTNMELPNVEESVDLLKNDESQSFVDILGDFKATDVNSFKFSDALNDLNEWPGDQLTDDNTARNVKLEKLSDCEMENSCDSIIIHQRPEITSLFTTKEQRPWPWLKKKISMKAEYNVPMSQHEEEYLLQKLNKRDTSGAPPSVKRLYRKLCVRRLKRDNNLPVFNVDRFGHSSDTYSKLHVKTNRILDRFHHDFNNIKFEQRLQGHCEPSSVLSPYTNRILKPYIRRDVDSKSLWLDLMDELTIKVNRNSHSWKLPSRAPLDYSYIRPQHIPAINSLCSQFFWPGVDLTECLQYPDFSCVVLYKKLVVGFAVMVPDVSYSEAYISFFLTRPEWRRAGIGTFMLYHLIQTCMGKDVTLHVSATNPALILYQKFGFKVEEFVQDFYDKYMPPSSRECRHALFLRLSR